MSTLADIRSPFWQLSLTGAGNIEQGYNDVSQCIDVILRTQKGTDPLRPNFGSNIFFYQDAPVNIAIPNIKREIIDAISIWEPRVEIVRITHTINGENLLFAINYRVVDDNQETTAQLLLNKNGFIVTDAVPAQLILQAVIPAGWAGRQLLLEFLPDGRLPAPVPPIFGFANPTIMLAWVRSNWGYYGRWYLLRDKLVCFVRPGLMRTATLTITLTDIYRYAAVIPDLAPGQQLQAAISGAHPIGGGTTIAFTTDPCPNMAALLAWLNANFGFGTVTWAIENSVTGNGDFDAADFDSSDFATTNISYSLVAYTTTFDSFNLIVNAV